MADGEPTPDVNPNDIQEMILGHWDGVGLRCTFNLEEGWSSEGVGLRFDVTLMTNEYHQADQRGTVLPRK